MNPENASTETDLSLGRGVLYKALALGFRPPKEETKTQLVYPEGHRVLMSAAAIVDCEGWFHLSRRVERLRDFENGSAANDALSTSFQRLFGHTARGPVSPYETEYGNEALFQQPHEMGDLAGFYRAFGLVVDATRHERPDHVSCECEFMYVLTLKEQYALDRDDPDMHAETRKAARLFLRDHLGRFGIAFANKLHQEDPQGFYGALGNLCAAYLDCECRRLGVAAGPIDLTLRPSLDAEVPMACGGEDCAAASSPGSQLLRSREETP